MDHEAILSSLRETGIAALMPLDGDEMDRVHRWFDSKPVYVDAHMPHTAINRGEQVFDRFARRVALSECICAPMPVTIRAPYIFERGLAIRSVAAAYLKTDRPLAYSMNAFWTKPGTAALRGDIQSFHRDLDDPKGFLAMFVYLTDVTDDDDGPHELRGPDGLPRRVYGRAGTIFLADTSHEHRGLKPVRRTRGLAWFRWGVSDPPDSYVWDKNEPINAREIGAGSFPVSRYPEDPVLRESIKLLVRP
jgi:hypothetical protein